MNETKPYASEMTKKITEWLLASSNYPSIVLHEQRVNKHVADIIMLEKRTSENKIIVVEIKSPRDDFRRMIDQCRDYMNWADEVYIGIEKRDREKTEKFISGFSRKEKIGIIVIADEIEKITPERENFPCFDDIEWSVSKDVLVSTGIKHDIEIDCRMRKSDIVETINSHPQKKEIVKKSLIKTFIYKYLRKSSVDFFSDKNISIWFE